MTSDTRIQVARMATDLTIALIANKDELGRLKEEVGIGLKGKAGPLSIFDKVYGHLLSALSEPTNK